MKRDPLRLRLVPGARFCPALTCSAPSAGCTLASTLSVLHTSISARLIAPPAAALYPPQPRRLSPTRPHCLWRVIDFLPVPEKRAASARLEVTHFPGAFSSLLIKRSPGPPHSLLIHSAIRATPPLRTPSIGWRAGGRARLAEEQRRIFAQHFGALLQLFEI